VQSSHLSSRATSSHFPGSMTPDRPHDVRPDIALSEWRGVAIGVPSASVVIITSVIPEVWHEEPSDTAALRVPDRRAGPCSRRRLERGSSPPPSDRGSPLGTYSFEPPVALQHRGSSSSTAASGARAAAAAVTSAGGGSGTLPLSRMAARQAAAVTESPPPREAAAIASRGARQSA